MGWERRQRGGLYFYRSIRVNGRPRKLYLGAGPAALAYARQEAERRARRQSERAALYAEQVQATGADRAFQDARTLVELLVRARLVLNGFHLHHREWRRRHGYLTPDRQGREEPTPEASAGRPSEGQPQTGARTAAPARSSRGAAKLRARRCDS